MLTAFVCGGVFLSLAMAGGWVLQRRLGNAGWVDSVWSLSLGAAGLMVALLPGQPAPSPRQWAVAALVALWALRLGLHIATRTAGTREDTRYAALRRDWGSRFQQKLFWFLQIQAAAAALLLLSIMLAAHNPAPWPRPQDLAGFAVLMLAIGGEAVADWQLRRFRATQANRGQVCQAGLWGWSRHPNYFFEWLVWVAYPLLAIDITGDWAWGWLALSGPVFMYWLLVHVSGIPLLEQQMVASRGDAYRAYQARVSPFLPFPPRGCIDRRK